MGLVDWCTRRVGGLSMIALIALCYWVITRESTLQRHGYKFEHPETQAASYTSTLTSGAGLWTYVFVYYCIIVHLAILGFPLRACWSIWELASTISRNRSAADLRKPLPRRASYTSVSSSETLISDRNGMSTTASSSEMGDVELEPTEMYTDGLDAAKTEPIIHAIVMPNYKEEVDTLKETLEVLASHPNAHDSYDVSLLSVVFFQQPRPISGVKLRLRPRYTA